MSTILTDDALIDAIRKAGLRVIGPHKILARAVEAAVLAKLREQEPVAWWHMRDVEQGISFSPDQDPNKDWQPLYTHPAPQQADRQRVPDGYVLVPVEPTDKMVQAAHHIDLSYMPGQEGADRAAVFRAMLAAAPEAPALGESNLPTTDELEALYETTHYGHPADFAADVLERWGGWMPGLLGHGGALQDAVKIRERRAAPEAPAQEKSNG